MIRLPVPEIAFGTENVTLSGEAYELTYRFNERMGRWKLDIEQADGTPVTYGLTLIEGTSPTSHLTLDNLPNGNLFVAQTEASEEKAGRNNLGIGKTYELIYIDNAELI